MKRSFLGKPIPEHRKPQAPRRAKPMWFGLMILPAVLAGGLLSLQRSALSSETGPRTTGGALAASIAAGKQTTETRQLAQAASSSSGSSGAAGITGGAAGGASGTTTTSKAIPNPCTMLTGVSDLKGNDLNEISEAFRRISDKNGKAIGVSKDVVLFPLIPDGIRGVNRDGVLTTAESTGTDSSKLWCSQPFWTITVAYWFIYKVLAILNWLAVALAILLSLYAAVLYILGFAKEDNVKKAKGILTGAYVGLAIVFLAKVLVFGAVNAVSGQDPTSVNAPVNLENQ